MGGLPQRRGRTRGQARWSVSRQKSTYHMACRQRLHHSSRIGKRTGCDDRDRGKPTL